MNKKRILAFGNPVYDVISTPSFRRSDRILSGCSTNACLAVTKMSEQALLIGTIGDDYANQLREEMTRYGIVHNLLPSLNTGGFGLVYDERGNRELSVLGIADPISPSVNGYNNIDFILLGPIMGEVSFKLVENIKLNTDAPILLDPQGLLRVYENGLVVHRLTREFETIAPLCTVIKANELETLTITGVNPRLDPDTAVKILYAYGCKIAIVTLAEAGSVIYDGKKIYHIPPFITTAIDPTGAGDTYAAGFMVRYLETKDLLLVGCFASSVASVMVENVGPGFPLTRAMAEQRSELLLSGSLEIRL
jgi:sugar/nucleoside kinase (ribokinase family)